jgi:hypothetical protein
MAELPRRHRKEPWPLATDLPEFASKKEVCVTELADLGDTLLRLGHVSDNGTSEIQGTTLIKWNARGDALSNQVCNVERKEM